LASRLLRRAAVFLCKIPRLAALSKARAASSCAVVAASPSPAAAAAWTFLVEVLRALLVAMLRWWRFSFWMFGFF